MIINGKKCDLQDSIEVGVNQKDEQLKIILIGINNIVDAGCMFKDCISLQSLPDIH